MARTRTRAAPFSDARAVLARAKRPKRIRRKITADDILRLDSSFNRLATQMRKALPPLRGLEQKDLVQECFLHTLKNMGKYGGFSRVDTWATAVARNHLIGWSRRLGRTPTTSLEDKDAKREFGLAGEPSHHPDPCQRIVLRSHTRQLISWLKSPDGISHGWEVLNLLFRTHADWSYTANALCIHTGRPWTTERVRNVVRAIKVTPEGRALCDSLGIQADTPPTNERD